MPSKPDTATGFRTLWHSSVAGLFALAVASAGCRKADPTAIIVGVQSEAMGGVVSALHIVVRVAGAVVVDETLKPQRGSRVGFPQPWEKRLSGDGKGTAPVDVEVDAIGSPDSSTPLFTRLSSTHFVPGRVALLRVPLEARCIVYPTVDRGSSKVPGPLNGPTCTAPATCIMGLCQFSAVDARNLESYTKDWPANAPDRCKPRNGGPPALQVGTGQSYYLPLTSGQTLQAEAGPQGGHHIWIAVRMKNMKQAGSTTRVSAVQPDTGTVIPSSTFAFTFERDEGGYCKLYGLRYQLDNGGIDYTQFLGKPLDVTTTVVDGAQATASSTVRIQVAPTLRNP